MGQDQKATEKKIKQTKSPKISYILMPSKFITSEKAPSLVRKIVLGILLVILVVGISGGIFYLSWRIQKQKKAQVVTRPQVEVSGGGEVQDEEEEPLEPQEAEEPEEEGEEPQEEPVFAVEYTDSRDTDLDGLTDVEETLYNTFPVRPDSDGDGHTDSVEVLNFYNPSGLAPASLIDSGVIKSFENEVFNYILFYPSSWRVDDSDVTKRRIRFLSQIPQEEIWLIVEENPEKLSIVDWYIAKDASVDINKIESFTLKSGLRGVRSENGLEVYLIDPIKESITATEETTYVYGVKYVPGAQVELNFRTTFEMMFKSLLIVEAPPVMEEEEQAEKESGLGLENPLRGEE